MRPLFSKIFCTGGPMLSPLFLLQIPLPYTSIPPFSLPFLPPVHSFKFSGFFICCCSQIMFFHGDEAVQFPCPPVLETMFTESEIQGLFSLINQSGDPASPSSGSQGSNRAVYSMEERKLRRMQSNRESARRSRCRKKRHLENLTNQVNRLRIENRELKNRLGFAMHQHLLLSLQNDQLRSESVALLATLSDLYEILGTLCFHNIS